MSTLFRTWVRALRGADGLQIADVGCAVPFAGSGLDGLSLPGRVPLAPSVVADLLVVSLGESATFGHSMLPWLCEL